MKKIYLCCNVLIFMLYRMSLSAQESVNIRGSIFDEQLNIVENATVKLYRQSDNHLLTSAVSDSTGIFNLSSREERHIYILVEHLAYQQHKLSFNANNDTTLNIFLTEQVQKINEAVVTFKKKVLEFKNGNLIVNVDQLSGNNDNMTKLLNRLPGVTLSDNKGLTLDGSPAKLYINGQEQKTFSNSQILSIINSLPPASVEQIELINTPLAEYSAASGAVINIKTKQKRFDGYNLYISNSSDLNMRDGKPGTSTTVSYMVKKNKIMFNTSFVHRNSFAHSIRSDSTVYKTTNTAVTNNRDITNRTNAFMNSTNLQVDIFTGHKLNFNFNAYTDRYNGSGKANTLNYNTNGMSDVKLKSADTMICGREISNIKQKILCLST